MPTLLGFGIANPAPTPGKNTDTDLIYILHATMRKRIRIRTTDYISGAGTGRPGGSGGRHGQEPVARGMETIIAHLCWVSE